MFDAWNLYLDIQTSTIWAQCCGRIIGKADNHQASSYTQCVNSRSIILVAQHASQRVHLLDVDKLAMSETFRPTLFNAALLFLIHIFSLGQVCLGSHVASDRGPPPLMTLVKRTVCCFDCFQTSAPRSFFPRFHILHSFIYSYSLLCLKQHHGYP